LFTGAEGREEMCKPETAKPVVPSREEFAAMAARGKLWKHGKPDPRTPTPEELARAQTPVDYGRAVIRWDKRNM
jgi:hypothetical protein